MWNKYLIRVSGFLTNLSLHMKILGITVGFIVLFGLGVTFEMRNIVYNTMLEELDKQGNTISMNLAARSADLVLTNNVFELHQLLRHTIENTESVRYAFIVNSNNEVVVHTFLRGFPTDLKDVHYPYVSTQVQKALLDVESNIIHDFAAPIIDGKAGFVRIGFDESAVYESINIVTRTIMQTTLAMILVGILAAYILAYVISRPITNLVDATKRFSSGDYDHRVDVTTNDDVGKLGNAFNEMGEILEVKEVENMSLLLELEKKEQVRKTLLKKVITAQELERKRISRELHDETGQLLSSLMLHLRHIKDSGTSEEFDTNIENMRQVISKTINEVKRLSQQLRPSVLDDMGLISAIERVIIDYREVLGIDIDLVVHGETSEQRITSEIEIAVYRILQEALTNIYKYAKAENVSVILNFRQKSLQMIIEDDGVGFDSQTVLNSKASEKQLGIYGMKERAELLDGTYEIESNVGVGTTIYVTIPIIYEGKEMS
ncbi:sensor histidine kinase [Desulfuribacillus alkaliarsenatis]|uniref:histidine kinase n=1 Tax=Desulfuribacillus alkaliarsenatis TaxID=766136 RepID=A0A1E5G0N3_9FIRM|nr:histidine kinase [Desulfuribacillus alkaliarsenatis]OEF96472.1 hypothetical protein BHF68_07385 [Desulfuribacillus alkaliarsenatis]